MKKRYTLKDLPRNEYLQRLKRLGMTEAEYERELVRNAELSKKLNSVKFRPPSPYPDFPGLSGDLHRAAMAEWRKQNR